MADAASAGAAYGAESGAGRVPPGQDSTDDGSTGRRAAAPPPPPVGAAKSNAAGSTAAGPSRGKPLPPLPPAEKYATLKELLELLLGESRNAVQAALARNGVKDAAAVLANASSETASAPAAAGAASQTPADSSAKYSSYRPSTEAIDRALLTPLGFGFSLPRPPRAAEAKDAGDTASLTLVPGDLPPGFTGDDWVLKLGPTLPAANKSSAAFLLDRHRSFCHPLFEGSREFTNFWHYREPSDSPLVLIRDTKLVFESAKDAAVYFRRGWRFLSENSIPDPPTDRPLQTSMVFGKLVHEELPAAETPAVGDACRLFRTRSPAATTLAHHEGIIATDCVIALCLVGAVIIKMVLVAGRDEVPADTVAELLLLCERRCRDWLACESITKTLTGLDKALADFRKHFLMRWQARVRVLDAQIAAQSPKLTLAPEPCVVCHALPQPVRRCSACRAAVYCGAACQKKHWADGHKKMCSMEFAPLPAAP